MMATSGVVGTFKPTVQELLDQCVLMAGGKTSDLTAEAIQTSIRELNYWLTALSNDGINLWCIEDLLVGQNVGQLAYAMPVGTIDVLNANIRQTYRLTDFQGAGYSAYSSAGGFAANAFDSDLETACTQTSPNGYIEWTFGSPTGVCGIGVLVNVASTLSLVLEGSSDEVTWKQTLAIPAQAYDPTVWTWVDAPVTPNYKYWRVRETGGATLDITELVFCGQPSEIPLYRMNRDDYFYLPNKQFLGKPLQFWFDRQIDPIMNMWPVPNDWLLVVHLKTHRHIQDVTEFNQNLAVPQRWYNAIRWALAYYMCFSGLGDPNRLPLLKGEMDKYTMNSTDEERDNSPIYLTPNIGVYNNAR